MSKERSKAPGGGGQRVVMAPGQMGPTTVRKKIGTKRAAARERLEFNLKELAEYCQPPVDWLAEFNDGAEDPVREKAQWLDKRRVLWPPCELLWQINDDVIQLAMVKRKKPILPVWKAYEQVDKRLRKFGLVSRLNDLLRRAVQRLAGESELGRAARESGSVSTQCLLGDIQCGAKSLDRLLADDRRRIEWKVKALPLVEWVITVGHPFARDFGAVVEHYALDDAAWEERKRSLQREAGRARIRRHRKKPVEKALHDLGRSARESAKASAPNLSDLRYI